MTRPMRPRGGPGSRITDEAKARVIELIADGATVLEAAAAVGYTDRTVHRETTRDRHFFDAMASAAATGAEVRRRRRRQQPAGAGDQASP